MANYNKAHALSQLVSDIEEEKKKKKQLQNILDTNRQKSVTSSNTKQIAPINTNTQYIANQILGGKTIEQKYAPILNTTDNKTTSNQTTSQKLFNNLKEQNEAKIYAQINEAQKRKVEKAQEEVNEEKHQKGILTTEEVQDIGRKNLLKNQFYDRIGDKTVDTRLNKKAKESKAEATQRLMNENIQKTADYNKTSGKFKKLQEEKNTQKLTQYYADAEKVENEKITTFDKINPVRAILSGFLSATSKGTYVNENGDRVLLPSYNDLKVQKTSEKSGKLGKSYQGAMQSFGSMIPSMVASSMPVFGKEAGVAMTFATSANSAMNQKLLEGYNEEDARKYGIVSGTLEASLGALLGGATKIMGGKSSALSSNLQKLTDKIFKSKAASYLVSHATAEVIEEEGQTILDPINEHITLGKYSNIGEALQQVTLDDITTTALSTLMTIGFTEGKTGYDINKLKKNIDIINKEYGTDFKFVEGSNEKVASDKANKETTVKELLEQAQTGKIDTSDMETNKNRKLSQNEKIVVDSVVENRIEELKEKNGKVSKKEKAKIEEEVRQDLERGYIEQNDIERALSNEEWNKHNDIVKKKETLQEELKDLQNKKMSDMTVEEYNDTNNKISSLKEQIDSIDTDTTRNELNSAMNGKVTDNDTLLQNIYGKKIETGAKKVSLSEQLEKQGTKIMEQAIADENSMIENFKTYLEENNIKNPTQQDIDNSLVDLLGYDNEQTADENAKTEQKYNKVIQEYLKEQEGNQNKTESTNDSFNLKQKQLDIIKDSNQMQDDYHTGIRELNDIKTAEEAFKTKIDLDEDYAYPDFTQEDGEKALQSGKITVYSSYPIEQGVFVTPSKMMAQDYAGNNNVYSKEIDVNDVAWINTDEGQYAKVENKIEQQNNDSNIDRDFLEGYPNSTIRHWESSNNDVVVKNYKQLDSLIDEAINTNENINRRLHLGRINESIVSKVRKMISNFPKKKGNYFSSDVYDIVLNQSEIRHLRENKTRVTNEDIHDYVKKIPDIISEPDNVIYSDDGNSEGLRFEKKYDDGKYYSFTLVNDKKKTLQVKTSFMDTSDFEAKKRSMSLPKDAQRAPSRTSETSKAFASYGNNIPQNEQKVNNDISTNSNMHNVEKNVQKETTKEVKKAIAPLHEEVKALRKEISELREERAITQQEFEEQYSKIAPLLEEQEAPPETEQIYDNLKDTTKMSKRELKALSKNIKESLGLTNKQKLDLEDIIQDYSTSETATREDLYNEIKNRYGKQAIINEYEDIRNVQTKVKSMKLDVSDNIKHDIADYNMLKQKNFGKLSFSKNGQQVDTVYQELSEEYPNYFPDNIYNETDQFLKIVEVANLENKSIEEYDIDDDYIRDTSDFIYDSILDSKQDALQKSIEKTTKESLQGDLKAPLPTVFDTSEIDSDNAFDEVRLMEHKARKKQKAQKIANQSKSEGLAPYIEFARENNLIGNDEMIETLNKADAEAENEQIEEQKKTKPKNESKLKKTKNALQYMITNENAEIDDYSKLSGNKEIKYSADRVTNIRGLIEKNINENQTDNNGKTIGKGIVQIFNQANDVGLSEAFNDYLFHLSNIERHKWGKGSQVPMTDSLVLVDKYEKAYPEMKAWAKEVNKYNKNLLYKQADAGLITKDLADNLSERYEFYVPFMEDIEGEYTPDNNNTIKTRSTVKRAKGGSSKNLLSFEDAMIKQTQTAISQIAKNKLYQEIVKTKENASIDFENNTNPDIKENGLFNNNGKYYLTAYTDGKATQVEIDKSLYHGLAKTEKQAIQNLEKSIQPLLTPLQKTSAIARKTVTTWSPAFLAKNFVKDLHDGLWNTKYLAQFPKNYIKAHKELLTRKGGAEFEEFLNNYGAENLRGDYSSLESDFNDGISVKSKSSSNKKGIRIAKSMFTGIARLNENIELAPRLAEYHSSRDAGCSVEESMYNAREITTNFGRGGIVTKSLNRNGFNFLNASMQGLSKTARNLSGENGTRALVGSLARATAFGMAPALINALLLGDDDDYEVIPDYIKDNYILIKVDEEETDKYDNLGNVVKSNGSTYIRIPYGRAMSIFGSAARRTLERAQGKRDDISLKDDFTSWGKNAWNQIGVTDMGSSFITAPITQAKNNRTWYGTDLVPKRLQKDKDGKIIPPEQQYDASTDKISVFLGKKLGVSPYKINYVIDQYSGGIGDIILPTITPEAQSNTNSTIGMMLAPIKDQFVVDSITDNKYVTKFYSKVDELGEQLNRTKSKKDEISYNYMKNISYEMGSLYAEMRSVQEDSSLTRKQKYAKAQNIKAEINRLAKEGINGYKDVESYENYARVGDRELYKYQSKNGETGWSDSEGKYADDINTLGLTVKEKNEYYTTKMKMSDVSSKFKEDEGTKKYKAVLDTISKSKLPSDAKYELYNSWYGKTDEVSTAVQDLGIPADEYIKFKTADLTSDKNKKGYAIKGSKANKVINYLNKTNLNEGQKAILYRISFSYKGSYSSTSYSNAYNNEIVNYINNSSLTYEESVDALKKLGFKVSSNGNISW